MATNYTVEDLLAKAAELIQSFENVELAEKFYAKALEMEPENTAIMDDYAECLLELGDVERATELLKQSIEKDPEGGYQKYMNAGQLASGVEALGCFNKGIEIMIRMHNNPPEDAMNTDELPVSIAAGYCSMVEIFMTDCCFEEQAEEECLRLIEEALKWNSSSVEAHLLKAQFFLAQQNNDAALPCILTSYDLWKNLEVQNWPNYPIRVSTAKVLLEVYQTEKATELLEQLTHEDDEDSEIWYLLGLSYYNYNEHDSTEYLEDAEECLKKAQNLLRQQEDAPEGALEKVQSLLRTVREDKKKATA